MAEALSSISIPLITSPYSSFQRISFISKSNSSLPHRHCQTINTQTPNPHQSLKFSGFSLKPLHRNFGFPLKSQIDGGGEREESVVDDEFAKARGEGTMPDRFRYLTKEAPDRPVRWPWLIAVAFGIYAWRTVLWELSNWKKGALAIARFIGYLSKLAFAIIYPFIGPSITFLIRSIETALYTVGSVYSSIVASAPVQELTVIILLTSTLLAIAEAAVPDSTNSQPYLLSLAGIIGFAAVTDFIPELVFWLLLMGIFCFSRFFKKRDLVSSALPAAAALCAVGQPWLRVVVMTSYATLAIFHYSENLSESKSDVEATASTVRKLPAPLLVAALTIGINIAAKWVRYRHLTWMIV